jgi:hypothetical protein
MIDTVVRGALKTIFSGRLYPSTFIQKDGGLPQWPSGRYTIIDSINEPDVCGTDTTDTDDTRVQLDVVAATRSEMVSIVAQVITAMQGLDPPAIRDGLFETFDEATRTYRTVLDYRFYASSVVTS